jgi:hypothetical protein
MMKKIVLLASAAFLIITPLNAKLLTFTNPSIHSLDGITYMIDGVAVHDILIVLKKSGRIHNGKRVGTKTVGKYLFNGTKASIKQLSQLEKASPNDPQLAVLLTKSKHDFIEITKDFMDGIDTAKNLIVDLMGEFCECRNRPNSIILSWANAKQGSEEEIFNKSVKTFVKFDEFLTDLTLFLKDLIHSCPKARQQYKEWYKKQRQ